MNIILDYGNAITESMRFECDVIETFDDIHFVMKRSLGNESFSISIMDGRYVGSSQIPYSSKISEKITENDIIFIKLEPSPYINEGGDIYRNITRYSSIIEEIKLTYESRRDISDRNFALIQEAIPDISPSPGLYGRVTLEGALSFDGNLFSDAFTVLTGTRLVNTITMEDFNNIPEEIYLPDTFIGDPLCIVCQCDFEDGDDLKVLPCEHKFHTDCVQTWLTVEKNECPLCRAKVCENEEDIVMETEDIVPTSLLFD